MPEVVLVRHGETEWSRSGRHTGRTDVPLTDEGRRQAHRIASMLAGRDFVLVVTSPMGRSCETAALAGYPDAQVLEDLREWDYGDYEGRTTADIRAERPGWLLWRDGCPNGETATDVGARADRVLAKLRRGGGGEAAVFGHGHMLRVLGARWAGLRPEDGGVLVLGTASLSVLGYEREVPAVCRWNCTSDP